MKGSADLLAVSLLNADTKRNQEMRMICLLCFNRRHFFVVAIGTSLDTLEPSLDLLGQAKGARDALLQGIEGARKRTLIDGHARGEAADKAFVAIPLVGQMVRLHHVHALEVERARAAIAADDVSCITTRRAVLVVVGSLGCPPLLAQAPLPSHRRITRCIISQAAAAWADQGPPPLKCAWLEILAPCRGPQSQ